MSCWWCKEEFEFRSKDFYLLVSNACIPQVESLRNYLHIYPNHIILYCYSHRSFLAAVAAAWQQESPSEMTVPCSVCFCTLVSTKIHRPEIF